jgi:hypothetical protein
MQHDFPSFIVKIDEGISVEKGRGRAAIPISH